MVCMAEGDKKSTLDSLDSLLGIEPEVAPPPMKMTPRPMPPKPAATPAVKPLPSKVKPVRCAVPRGEARAASVEDATTEPPLAQH